jgi:CRP/FNR family cyclic AMP-dependent transcriptional regulator
MASALTGLRETEAIMNQTLDPKKSGSMRQDTDVPREKIVDFIVESPLFQDLEQRELELLARYFKLFTVDSDSIVFREGEAGDSMALIVDGKAELRKGSYPDDSVLISIEGVGRTVGEMALIDGEPRSATVKFAKAGKILMLTKDGFDLIMAEHPRLAFKVLWRLCRVLSQRLRRTTGILSDQLQMHNQVNFTE